MALSLSDLLQKSSEFAKFAENNWAKDKTSMEFPLPTSQICGNGLINAKPKSS